MNGNFGNFEVNLVLSDGEKSPKMVDWLGMDMMEEDPLLEAMMAELAAANAEVVEVQPVEEIEIGQPQLPPVDTIPHEDETDINIEAETRFKTLTEGDLNDIEKHRHSESTKKNTKWGINLFKAWCVESGLPAVDMKTVQADALATLLRQFYASAAPKKTEQRLKSLPEKQAAEYHKNSLKNIRAAINRNVKDLDRDIDIVRDKGFKKANDLLNAKLKLMMKSGASRPTKHKPIIDQHDLLTIDQYLHSNGPDSPELLMYTVWYNLSVHFVSRGLEFHHQLTQKSFDFCVDGSGRKYVTLTYETQQKNLQGGLGDPEAPSDKRMYATNDLNCPVKALETFLSHCDPSAEALFCRPIRVPTTGIYYTCKPISKRMFVELMGKISKDAGCSKIYTAHSLRATSIQMLSDAGVETRHIMLMSGHRNEGSVRSYSRDCSEGQKRTMSDTLAGKCDSIVMSTVPLSQVQPSSTASTVTPMLNNVPHTSCYGLSSIQSSASSTVSASSGFLNHSKFDNCQFSFVTNKDF